METGGFCCIPANVPHGDLCIGEEPFVMLDIFYPEREDLIARLMGAYGSNEPYDQPL